MCRRIEPSHLKQINPARWRDEPHQGKHLPDDHEGARDVHGDNVISGFIMMDERGRGTNEEEGGDDARTDVGTWGRGVASSRAGVYVCVCVCGCVTASGNASLSRNRER